MFGVPCGLNGTVIWVPCNMCYGRLKKMFGVTNGNRIRVGAFEVGVFDEVYK